MKWFTRALFVAALIAFASPAFAAAPKAPAGGPPKKELTAEQKKKMEAGKDDLLKFINDRLKHRFTPVIQKVTVGSASVGKPVSVSVQTAYDTKGAKGSPVDKIAAVKVFYSLDGGKNWEDEVSLKKSGNAWTGSIPAIRKKGKVTYYVLVKDSYGNSSVDFPCKISSWPPMDDGCMISLGSDPAPEDDPTGKTPDDFDLWEARAGMDDKYVYYQMSVEGSIAKGSMNPVKITSYMGLIADAKALNEMADATEIMNAQNNSATRKKMESKADMIRIASYTPMAPAANSAMKACFLINPAKGVQVSKAAEAEKKKGKEMDEKAQKAAANEVMDDKSITCKKDGPDLFLRIDRKAMGQYVGNSGVVVFMLGYIDNMEVPMPKIMDVSNFFRYSLNQRAFTVK